MEMYVGMSVILPTAAGEIGMHFYLTGEIDKGGCCMVLNFCCSLKHLIFT